MKVYKFGGASVKNAEGVKNLYNIARAEAGGLFIIVSAMGKTTNALELVTEYYVQGRTAEALDKLAEAEQYHAGICSGLFTEGELPQRVKALFDSLKVILKTPAAGADEYEKYYDLIVGYGELISTTVISEYFSSQGTANKLLDIRNIFITDHKHKDANILLEESGARLTEALSHTDATIVIGQGFIGGTSEGAPTTIGREGSDYSAAVAAHLLNAESVTIWKDVEGILNADPKIFQDTTYIPELTYLDAIELAYSGAQIIHPKTIKPLQNKNIPLYVRPFTDPSKPGSVIKKEIAEQIDIPILILKHNQVLLSVRPNDFSFVLEDRLVYIFTLLEQYGVKINLIQSSAVNLSMSIDKTRHLETIAAKLKEENFRVAYNEDMELITIRGYDEPTCRKYDVENAAYLIQKTRKIIRIVRKITRS